MGTVPDSYYQFIIDYAPYIYVVPGSGPDLTFGKAALAAAFAIDFLTQAYNTRQFENKQTEIYTQVVSLAEWLLTQQYTADPQKKAYGGFKSTETSTSYCSIDAARVIPALTRFRLCKEFGWTPNQLAKQSAKTIEEFIVILSEVDRQTEEQVDRAKRETHYNVS